MGKTEASTDQFGIHTPARNKGDSTARSRGFVTPHVMQHRHDLHLIICHLFTGVDAKRIDPDAVDHLLLHYSARSLREEIVELMVDTGAMIDEAKWFNNLASVGNTGSASIWIMLDGLMKDRPVRPGDQVLCIVPESGRAMVGFMQLTAVSPDGEAG